MCKYINNASMATTCDISTNSHGTCPPNFCFSAKQKVQFDLWNQIIDLSVVSQLAMTVVDVLVEPRVTRRQKRKLKIDAWAPALIRQPHMLYKNSSAISCKEEEKPSMATTCDIYPEWLRLAVVAGPTSLTAEAAVFAAADAEQMRLFSYSFLGCCWSPEHSAFRSFTDSHNI